MPFNAVQTERIWPNVRAKLLARSDITSDFKFYEVSATAADWKVSRNKNGAWMYLEGLVDKVTKEKIHLSCNVTDAVWDTFHVTEYAGNRHVANLQVAAMTEDETDHGLFDYTIKCIRSSKVVDEEGKHKNMKITKKERQRTTKLKEAGGKVHDPIGDMNHIVNAIAIELA
jgi:hypothetical protein